MLITPLKRCSLWILVFLLFLVSAPVWAGEEGVVKGSVVNVRQGPILTEKVVAQVKAGQVLEIVGRNADWLNVRLHTGKTGWVFSELIETKASAEKVTVIGTSVNIRSAAGTKYSTIGQVNAGDVLTVLSKNDGWFQVDVPGLGKGWIASWLVKSQDDLVNMRYLRITSKIVNVRSGPGTNSSIVTKIGLNEEHEVTDEENGWYKIKVGNTEGWVLGTLGEIKYKEQRLSDNSTDNIQEISSTAGDVTTVVVTGDIVNVRQQANTNASIIGKVYRGERLNVVTKQGDWYYIKRTDGKEGWIASWLTDSIGSDISSRAETNTNVLIVPITDGKNFRIVESGGRVHLVLEGLSSNQYRIKDGANNTIILELDCVSQRNYQGQIARLGIEQVKVYPEAQKVIIAVAFSYPLTKNVVVDPDNNTTTIRITTPQSKSLSGKLIVLDPGHASIQPGGWLDPGALGRRTGLKEKDVNLSIVFKLKALLETDGARVILTHSGQTSLTLAGRAAVANNNRADLFISIHANSSEKALYSGHSTYYYAPLSSSVLGAQRYSRQRLATLVQREMVKEGGRTDLGIMEANFVVLRETTVPSILVETAFLSDYQEEILLGQDSYRQKLALGIYRGIVEYFR